MKIYINFLLLLLIPTLGLAQQQKTLHQTFEIEEVERLNFDLYDEIEVEKWEGNTVLTETKIEVHDATKGIFNHFVKEGRYEILLADTPSAKVSKTEQYALNEDYFNEDATSTTPDPQEIVEEEMEEAAAPAGPQEGVVYLTSKDSDRKPIRTRTGECLEIVKVRIFIPQEFNQSGQNSYFRTLPDEDDED